MTVGSHYAMRYAVLVLSQLAVASAALLARWGLGLGIGPGALTAWRLTLASALLLPILRLRRSGMGDRIAPGDAVTLVAAGAALGAHFWAWFISLDHIPVARSTLLVSTTPVWAGLAAWVVSRSAPRRGFWLALALAGAGAWMVTGGASEPPLAASRGERLYGDVMATLGAVCIGIYFVATSAYQERLGTLRVVAWTYPSAACAVWVGLAVSGGERGMRPVGVEPWLAVAALAIVPQLVGHTALNWSLKHFSAGAVGAATLLEPVFAGALAWALLGESLTPVQLLGAVVLLTGVGWALATGRRAPQGPALRRERDG